MYLNSLVHIYLSIYLSLYIYIYIHESLFSLEIITKRETCIIRQNVVGL